MQHETSVHVDAGWGDFPGRSLLDTLLQDVRVSFRSWRRSPAFPITAILTLALAIGVNAVAFAALNALILRPLDLPRADSLWGLERDGRGDQSYPNYLDLRDRNRTFESLAAVSWAIVGLDAGRDPSVVWGYATSGNYFDVLGVQPILGRFFHSSDEHGPNSAPFIVLSYSYWHNHFRDDPGVVGRRVNLNKHPFTIIGVASEDFHGTVLFFTPNFFVPIVNREQVFGTDDLNVRANEVIFSLVGHLKPGVSPAQAVADLNSVGSYLTKTYSKDVRPGGFSLERPGLLNSFLSRPVRAFVEGLMLLAVLTLLAACANLSSVFAARAVDRSREVALRLALGSSRRRILRGMFTEAILISVIGGVVGLLGSVVLLRALSDWQPMPVPIQVPVKPDLHVYLAALALTMVSGLLFGIVPLRQVMSTNPYEIVKAGQSSTFGRRFNTRDVLVTLQIAICAVLVTSSVVAMRGLVRSAHSNFGFEPRNVMLVDTNLAMAGYSNQQIPEMEKRVIAAMETVSGVEAVGLVNFPPLGRGGSWRANVYKNETEDLRPSNAAARSFQYNISPGYFRATGMTLLAGRMVTWRDDSNSPPVAIVNRDFAKKILGSEANALGRYFRTENGTRVQVIGIAENGKYLSLTEDQQPAMFLPILQQPTFKEQWIVVRSPRDPKELSANIKNQLHQLDASLPIEIETWNNELGVSLFPARVATVTLGILGIMGAILSMVGIFGMAAYSVSRRMAEFGIRAALGAQRGQVLQTALGRSFKLLGIGALTGLLLGILASGVLSLIVYQATPRDPLVLCSVVLGMFLLGLIGTWIPAHRALSVNPASLLREK